MKKLGFLKFFIVVIVLFFTANVSMAYNSIPQKYDILNNHKLAIESKFEMIGLYSIINELPFKKIKPKPVLEIPKTITEAKQEKWLVKKGDNVWTIAQKTGISQTDIIKWNQLNSKALILIGQELTLKDPGLKNNFQITQNIDEDTEKSEEINLDCLNAMSGAVMDLHGINIGTISSIKFLTKNTSLKRKNYSLLKIKRNIPSALAGVRRVIAKKFGEKYIHDLTDYIYDASEETGVSSELIAAKIRVESFFDKNALSSAGAIGLMQILPDTAKDMDCNNINDPRQNVLAGAKYLKFLYERYGDFDKTIAAYNAGPVAVDLYNGVPHYKETINHLARVKNLYKGEVMKT